MRAIYTSGMLLGLILSGCHYSLESSGQVRSEPADHPATQPSSPLGKAGAPPIHTSDEALLPEVSDELRKEVNDRFGGHIEAIQVAHNAGYDYLDVIAKCLLRRKNAMHQLFEMTEKAGFDAAASEAHCSTLHYVLRDVGDRFFGDRLEAEVPGVQKAVRNCLLFSMGFSSDSKIDVEETRDDYPRTFPAGIKLGN